ncbi:hypothetical protein GCM10007368_31210 [Isoptericola cucumis]|uniref:Uncharacterized protein n=2 Tax=Isoptericola cucumis TaxID=1776856 RepID=A0ABQ2BAC4_9MICO|nr:hypothetical protein GCM10007368_31210 [Isoptericola cucumis]
MGAEAEAADSWLTRTRLEGSASMSAMREVHSDAGGTRVASALLAPNDVRASPETLISGSGMPMNAQNSIRWFFLVPG